MPLVQDRSLDQLASSPAGYHCATDASPHLLRVPLYIELPLEVEEHPLVRGRCDDPHTIHVLRVVVGIVRRSQRSNRDVSI